MQKWLNNATFYQIYPTSFFDSNGDGVGDLQGIIQKLDYVKSLGCNAVWVNPFFPSPFYDGGYDVQDYYGVDPRFGTMEDFDQLVAACKQKGIRLVIDMVIGHSSFRHPWFLKSGEDQTNEYSDYYIWTDSNFNKYKDRTIHGLFPRDGGYYINYYACQPAFNYGFNKVEQAASTDAYSGGTAWQMAYDDPRLDKVRGAILDIMRFWLDRGVDGFRVDLANSLVKGCKFDSDDDKDIEGLIWLWNKMISTIKGEYPDCAFIAEWVYPKNAVGKCGFDVDFYAHDISCYNDLFRSEKGSNLLPAFEKGHSYFHADGKGSVDDFVAYTLSTLSACEGKGYISVPTGSHDQVRVAQNKSDDVLKTVFAFEYTFKHVPFVYYGDEVGIKHAFHLNKDGGYIRTGARTPMQWSEGENRGFSTAKDVYLPAQPSDGQSVQAMEQDENSLLGIVRRLGALRLAHPALWADADLEILQTGYPFVYQRTGGGETVVVALNPSGKAVTVDCDGEILLANNCEVVGTAVTLTGESFIIYKK